MAFSRFKFAICTLVVAAALLSMTASAHADTASPEVLDLLAKQQLQIQQLQSQVQELLRSRQEPAPTTAGAPASAMGMASAQEPAKAKKALDPEFVKQIEFPEKFRIIDNGDTTLGLYGTIEVTLNHNSTGGPYASSPTGGANDRSWIGIDKPWLSASKWGINGSHVLDSDTNTVLLLRLEGEYESPTGNMDTPGVLFNRDSWVGIQSPTIGKITVGRQNTLARDVNAIWAQPNDTARANLSEIGWFDNDVIVAPKTYFESATGSRTDASAEWKKQWGDNWITYAAYQFVGLRNDGGTDVVHNDDHSTETAVGLAYNSSSDLWHASGSYTQAKINGLEKKVYAFGGNVIPVPWLRVNGGVIRAQIEQPTSLGARTDTIYALSMQLNPGMKFEYVLGYNYSKTRNAAQDGSNPDGSGSTLAPFDATDAATFAADGSLGTIYALGLYRWDKVTTFYVATDYSAQKRGYVQKTFQGHTSATQLGLGVRYKF